MTTNIYRFYWDCGRQGDLQGVFAATPEQPEENLSLRERVHKVRNILNELTLRLELERLG